MSLELDKGPFWHLLKEADFLSRMGSCGTFTRICTQVLETLLAVCKTLSSWRVFNSIIITNVNLQRKIVILRLALYVFNYTLHVNYFDRSRTTFVIDGTIEKDLMKTVKRLLRRHFSKEISFTCISPLPVLSCDVHLCITSYAPDSSLRPSVSFDGRDFYHLSYAYFSRHVLHDHPKGQLYRLIFHKQYGQSLKVSCSERSDCPKQLDGELHHTLNALRYSQFGFCL